MRITAAVKEQTRTKILRSAADLFAKKGFDQTTTRDIATVVGMASGTLFNYFATKEALAMTLIAEALDACRAEFDARRSNAQSLEEELFLHILTGLRCLKSCRSFVGQVIETAMSPFARSNGNEDAERIRSEHLETVVEIIRRHTGLTEPSTVALHLYWSLYLGVLAYWSKDESRHQEETLVVLDQSTRLFVAALDGRPTIHGDDVQRLHESAL